MIAARPLRILVADDDPAMVGAITALVGPEGHQLITAYDGLTAATRFGVDALTLAPAVFGHVEVLARAAGVVVPHPLLARAGWPAVNDPDLLWLKPHLARLRAKVEGAGGPQILAVRGVGYRIEAGT